jgi:LSD1 subclass zinc finger protein
MDIQIVVSCSSCQRKLRLKAEYGGKKIRCPACQAVVVVPIADSKAAEIPPRSAAVSDPKPASAVPRQLSSTQNAPAQARRVAPTPEQVTRPLATPPLAASKPLAPKDTAPEPSRSPRSATRKPTSDRNVSDDMWLENADEGFDEQDDWVDESNPYAPPKSQLSSQRANYQTSGFQVDGQLIRCGTELRLPPICVRTGGTTDLTEVTKTLKHSPVWAYMVGGVILALIMQRSCKVTYFLSDVARKKQKKLLLIGLGIMGLGIIVMAIGAAMNIPDAMVPIGILVIVGGLITAILSQQSLKINKREGSTIFWIGGFKPAFFETLSGNSLR